MTRSTRLQKQAEPPRVGVVLHVAHVGGKPLRFCKVDGTAPMRIAFEDFAACLGFSRQMRRRHLRKVHTRWSEKVVVTVIDDVEVTLAPLWMPQAIVGHGRKFGWLDEAIADEFDAAVAAADTVAQERRAA